jgi:hypothetical protein
MLQRERLAVLDEAEIDDVQVGHETIVACPHRLAWSP